MIACSQIGAPGGRLVSASMSSQREQLLQLLPAHVQQQYAQKEKDAEAAAAAAAAAAAEPSAMW